MSRRADELIARLGLVPHPEGGYFRQTFRGGLPLLQNVEAAAPDSPRPPLTSIYFLLCAGQKTRWHRLDADEVWSFHQGAPLRLYIAEEDSPRSRLELVPPRLLGLELHEGQQPQLIVPRGRFQCAESLGEFTLVGCAMGPGFAATGFELL